MNALFTQTPLAFFIQDLWRDEAFSYILAKHNPLEIMRLTAQDFAPPLYYLALSLWIRLFGSSEIALRSLSLIFFAGTIFFMFEILIKVFKIPYKRAVVYLLLFMLNPFLVSYAFEARMYMMGAFFVTLSFFALFTKRRFLYIFAITCALYTHYFTILIFIGQIMSRYSLRFVEINGYLLRFFVEKGKSRSISTNLNKSQLVSIVLPVIFFLPWLIYFFINHNFSDRSFWVIKPLLTDFKYMPLVLYTGYERIFGEFYHGGAGYTDFHSKLDGLLILILSLRSLIYLLKLHKVIPALSRVIPAQAGIQKDRSPTRFALEDDTKIFKIIFWSFFPPLFLFITSFITQPFYFPRYFIFSVPGFLLLLVVSMESIFSSIGKMSNRFSFLIYLKYFFWGVIILLLFQSTNYYNYLNLKYHSKNKISGMYREISNLSRQQDEIFLKDELDYHLAQYYMPKKTVRIYAKSYSEIPQYIGKALISESAFLVDFPIYPARAFMVGYDSYEIVSRQ